MRKQVYIIAASGHAKVVIDIFEQEGSYEIAGIIDSRLEKGAEFFGYEVLGTRDTLSSLMKERPAELFVAIGDNWMRQKAVEDLLDKVENPVFANAIHPAASIARGVELGHGIAVMGGAVINSGTSIGNFAIVNTQSSVDHDCSLGSFASVAPGAVLGGNVRVGAYSAVAMGCLVKHGVSIGEHSVVGAGSFLLSECADHVVMYGTPAREIRSRRIGEKYL